MRYVNSPYKDRRPPVAFGVMASLFIKSVRAQAFNKYFFHKPLAHRGASD
jgi:hypothetical protein